jgi:hypothetical protein
VRASRRFLPVAPSAPDCRAVQVTGEYICTIEDVSLMVPRGRYKLDVSSRATDRSGPLDPEPCADRAGALVALPDIYALPWQHL